MKILTAQDAIVNIVNASEDPAERVVQILLGKQCEATVEFSIGMERSYGTDIFYTHMVVGFADAYGNPQGWPFDVLVGDLYGTDMGLEVPDYPDETEVVSERGYFFDDAVKDAVRQLVPIANLVLRTDEADVVTLHHGQVEERIVDVLLDGTAVEGAHEWLKANVDLKPLAEAVSEAFEYDDADNALDDAIMDKDADGTSILTRFCKHFGLKVPSNYGDDDDEEEGDDDEV